MKKIFSALFMATALFCCDSPEERPRNNDNTLSAIWVNVPGADENSARYNGVFNTKQDTVYIQVPLKTTGGISVNLKNLKLRGSVASDAKVVPALGLMDLTAPLKIDVISGLQEVKTYIVLVTQK